MYKNTLFKQASYLAQVRRLRALATEAIKQYPFITRKIEFIKYSANAIFNDFGEIFGGIQAHFDTESVYVEVLWVDEKLRKQGYGKKLLEAVEQEAINNGCIFSIVDTIAFQAEEFYLKNGYEPMGEIKKYWYEHSRIFLRKAL